MSARSPWFVLFYVLGSAAGFNKWAGLLNDWAGFDAALKPETLKSIRHALEQANDDPNDDSLRAEMLIRMPAPAERPPLPGELPADEGTDRQPLQRAPATPEGVAALFAKLAALHPTEGFHHRCVLDFANGWVLPTGRRPTRVQSVAFMLWLPAGFSERRPWPTVFSLHGQGETKGPGNFSEVGHIVRHGLPHRVAERVPFRDRFVLVSPMMNDARWNMSSEEILDGEQAPQWAHHTVTLEALRMALFSGDALDRERAYLPGVSIGGTGVWAWAAFNPNGVQPWAAIVPSSSRWPRAAALNDTRPFHVREAAALRRLAGRVACRVAHCANDRTVPIETGALLQPRCELEYFGEYNVTTTPRIYGPPACYPGADAIVEGLRMYGAQVVYDRYEVCTMVHMPTDTSFTSMYAANMMDIGHDSGRVYLGSQFVEWLLAQRLRVQDRWWSSSSSSSSSKKLVGAATLAASATPTSSATARRGFGST